MNSQIKERLSDKLDGLVSGHNGRLLEISCNTERVFIEVLKSQLFKVSVHFSASTISKCSQVPGLSLRLKNASLLIVWN